MQYSLAILALAVVGKANPVAFPQAVTAAISPPEPAPSGCLPTVAGSFGIAVHDVAKPTGVAKRQAASESNDGQIEVYTMAPVSQIGDGQIQGGLDLMTVTMPKPTPAPLVSEAPDAQPQVPTSSATVPVVSEAPDAQPQVPTSSATVPVVSEAPDAQPQVPTSSATVPVVSEAPDAQPQAPSSSAPAPSPTTPFPVVPPSASGMGGKAARPISGNTACAEAGSLAITLENGILKDHKGRTGYIAANYQFQFDGPPQAGAIITAGFSTCNNGSLALGGSNVFYKCLSGEFYNLYDRSWAAQCSPVTINTIMFKKC